MHSHVWWPDSVRDSSLAVVPLLEEVRAVLLMSWMDLASEDHPLGEFVLLETLVDEEIVLLVHGSVAALARSGEDLEASPEPVYKKDEFSKMTEESAKLSIRALNGDTTGPSV